MDYAMPRMVAVWIVRLRFMEINVPYRVTRIARVERAIKMEDAFRVPRDFGVTCATRFVETALIVTALPVVKPVLSGNGEIPVKTIAMQTVS